MLLSFQGNFLSNNRCVPCDCCNKGEFVVEECSPKRNTVCRKLPKRSRPSSSDVNSQEPVTGAKPFGGGTEIWVYRAVIMLLVLIILGLVLHKKIKLCQTIKTKVTTLKKCTGPKGKEASTTVKHLRFSKM